MAQYLLARGGRQRVLRLDQWRIGRSLGSCRCLETREWSRAEELSDRCRRSVDPISVGSRLPGPGFRELCHTIC
jgi:hypothetical protein